MPSACSCMRPWPTYQKTVFPCWMAAGRTDWNGRPSRSSRRGCSLMGRAARPRATDSLPQPRPHPVQTAADLVSPYTMQTWVHFATAVFYFFAQLLRAWSVPEIATYFPYFCATEVERSVTPTLTNALIRKVHSYTPAWSCLGIINNWPLCFWVFQNKLGVVLKSGLGAKLNVYGDI